MNRLIDVLRKVQCVKDSIKELNSKLKEMSYLVAINNSLEEVVLNGKLDSQLVRIKTEILNYSKSKVKEMT